MPWRALLLAGGVVTVGCAPAAPTVPVTPAPVKPTACLIVADSVGLRRQVTAVYEDSADAARTRRTGEVVPPIRLDCEGRPLAGLAVAWSRDTSGRFWTLALPPPDSTASLQWTAGALASTWRADPEAREILRGAGITSLAPIDDRRLVVGFAAARPELPTELTDLALGVALPDSRPTVVPIDVASDLRDAVDGGPDVIVARDPGLLDYARRRSDLSTRALPWSRSYLLIAPAGAPADLGLPADTAGFRADLARDAVREEARPAAAGGWWEAIAACPLRTPAPARSAADRIAYQAGDPVAREVAERLVALMRSRDVHAQGLWADSLSQALASGAARAFVIGVPS